MKQKILFVLPSLRGGGSERVILTLLKHFHREHFDIHLAIISKQGVYVTELPTDIIVHHLNVARVRCAFLPILRLVWKIKPDAILSTLGHLNIFLLAIKWLMPRKTKLIVRESNTVSEEIKTKNNPRLWKFLYRFFYKRANKVICQSNAMKQDLVENFHVPNENIAQIYNPVDVTFIEKKSQEAESPFKGLDGHVNIVAIGRLSNQKGFSRLIQSVPALLKQKPHAHLWILGEGELENELKEQVRELQLSTRIHFVGFQRNPYVWLKHADLFVLASEFEGLPNVLLEAIACECPVLASKHPGGTEEIMTLTNQNHRYVEKLIYEDYLFINELEKGKKLLVAHFGIDKIVAAYETVVKGTIGIREGMGEKE